MRISRMRGVASVLALSIGASTVGAAELTPGPSLWDAAQGAGGRASAAAAQTQAAPANSDSRMDRTFFKTTAGRLVLGLMTVGVGLTIYSIHHDRKPVKSPIR